MIRRLLLTVVLIHSTAQAVPAYLKKFYLQPELGLIRQQGELSGKFTDNTGALTTGKVNFSQFRPGAGLYLGRTFDWGKINGH